MIEQVLIALNLLVCGAGLLMCICRITHMDARTKMAIRVQYTLWLSMFIASALSYSYGEPASFIQLCMGGALVAHMIIGSKPWRGGAPPYTVRVQ